MRAGTPISQSTGLLLVHAAKLHRSVVGHRLGQAGLHVGQDLVLLELDGSEGLSQRELADRLGVEQATVGMALRRLESAGFVRRRPAADDARVRNALLTEKGEAALYDIQDAWRAAEEMLTGRLIGRQATELRRALMSVLDDKP